eukprot:TRINITY_DN2013_c0_g2_i2.p1 TRINITY_DN2013_c0_g2~~TRINITY_DN2013_c0_g2_i2.p1  ORF type:complete len:360 (+),score=135.36 TRINITY_DN2013_c0_g2_i2:117-1196(+)
MFQEAMVPRKLELPPKESADIQQARELSGRLTEPRKVRWPVASVLDGVVTIDITRAECKERGGGRKKKEDKDEYWLEAYGEQCEDKLVDAPVESDKLERSYWKSAGSDKDLVKMEDFYLRFGPKVAEEVKHEVWHRVDGMNSKEKIVDDINSLVDVWMEISKKNEEKVVTEIEGELQEEAKPKEEPATESKEDIQGEDMLENEGVKEEVNKEEKVEANEEEKSQKSHNEEEKLSEEMMADNWARVSERYSNTMNLIFKFYRKQKSMLVSGLTEMHRQFIAFFERPDDKQSLLDEFLSKLNALLADHPDYIENTAALKEILQNVDELDYRMWKVTEKKKDEAIAEREEKINSSNSVFIPL